MSNKEWLSKLSAEECVDVIRWLINDYAKNYSDGRLALIEWLKADMVGVE